MKKVADLIITSISELVTLAGENNKPRCGPNEMNSLSLIHNGAVAIKDSKILAVADTKQVLSQYYSKRVIKAEGKTVTPGLIDPHTHPVFIGDRADEFELKLKDMSYQEIADKGGGIKSTVLMVRNSTKEQLKRNTLKYLKRFIAYGTTTIEAKSGYGLTTKDEIKILEVIKELNSVESGAYSPSGINSKRPEMIPTFLGAHEIPDEYKDNKQGYVNLITREMLPLVATCPTGQPVRRERKIAEFCDVFVEKGVFSIDQARQILRCARKHGLKIKLHADEFTTLGGAELAAEFNATSADHLMMASSEGFRRMKEKAVIAVLLPGTTFTLGLKNYAPARKMIEMALPVALATDFNPGTCMCQSLPVIMTIACVMMKMTPAEALVATTINAAWAINRQRHIGSIEKGKQADIVIWSAPSYKHIPYQFGSNLVEKVIKKGVVV